MTCLLLTKNRRLTFVLLFLYDLTTGVYLSDTTATSWLSSSFLWCDCMWICQRKGEATFSSTAHWILQVLALSREATLGGCSWMQRQKLTLMQFPQKQEEKCEKRCPTVSTFTKCGVGGHQHVCKGYPCEIKGNSANKPDYTVRIISLMTLLTIYNHKRGPPSKSSSSWEIKPTLCWPVILSRPQKPSLPVQEWGIPPQWPWLLNAKMPVQLRSKDQVNVALAAVNGPSVSK